MSQPIAVISDVHANRVALEAVLEDIRKKGITRIIDLGDSVGYGPDPNGALDLVRKHCWHVLLGNHDQAATDLIHAFGFNPGAYESAVWTRAQLEQHGTSDPIGYLGTLEPYFHDGDVSYYHGSPRDPVSEYVFAYESGYQGKMEEIFALIKRVAFVGHTHEAGIFVPDGSKFRHLPQKSIPASFQLPAEPVLVNVGSVGQPRDQDPDACYVIFDGKTIDYVRVPYDTRAVADAIQAIPDLDPYFGERLITGR